MKIKCPFCHKIEEYRSYQMLGNHLQSHKDRGVYPFVITFCLAELIFKIHEKIRITEQIATQKNINNLHVYTIHQVIEELKSLLENK